MHVAFHKKAIIKLILIRKKVQSKKMYILYLMCYNNLISA